MPAKKLILGTTPDFLARDGLDANKVALWEDGMRCETGPGFFEWWYFDAHFDDGSTAVIVFFTKPLLERKGPLKPGIRLAITTPDGRALGGFPLFSPGAFSAARQQCDVRIRDNWVRGDLRQYTLHAEHEGVAADLEFTGIVPPWRPGAGKNYYDEGLTTYFGWLPPIPFGKVEGKLTYDGKSRKVSGTGYHDHNWGNISLNDVMSHWYWGRAHIGDYSLIFVEMNTLPAFGSQKVPVFMLAKKDKILAGDGTPLTMTARELEHHPGGRDFPKKVDFYWENPAGEGDVHLALRHPEMIEASDLLGLLKPWQRRIARLFAKPYYFRFNADLKLKIDLPNEKTTEKGKALFEIMMLR
jgi:hypothetical protein